MVIGRIWLNLFAPRGEIRENWNNKRSKAAEILHLSSEENLLHTDVEEKNLINFLLTTKLRRISWITPHIPPPTPLKKEPN